MPDRDSAAKREAECQFCGGPESKCYCDPDADWPCSHCGGDALEENDNPLWYGFDRDSIPCRSCGGTGSGRKQTVF